MQCFRQQGFYGADIGANSRSRVVFNKAFLYFVQFRREYPAKHNMKNNPGYSESNPY
jgi:hypothetical protein